MFLTILRPPDERCEQCDSTEQVLQFIGSEGDTDSIRLTACIVCVIVAMDNAMQWNMSRQFAQALANRAAGEHVQQLAREEKARFDARLRQAEERTRIPLSDHAETGSRSDLRPDSEPQLERGKGARRDTPSGSGTSGGARKRSTPSR